MPDHPWDLDAMTIPEAEALYAEPLPATIDIDTAVFAEHELLDVYRKRTEEMLAALDRVLPTLDEGHVLPANHSDIEACRDAIKKARGEGES